MDAASHLKVRDCTWNNVLSAKPRYATAPGGPDYGAWKKLDHDLADILSHFADLMPGQLLGGCLTCCCIQCCCCWMAALMTSRAASRAGSHLLKQHFAEGACQYDKEELSLAIQACKRNVPTNSDNSTALVAVAPQEVYPESKLL
jgi:hypothetical protein